MREVMSVRHALLALLSEGPRYSRQLREEFEAWTGEERSLNVGQVDTALQRLEREGLAESDAAGADGPQSGFRITADGERATARLRDHYAEGRLTREELDERVMAALKARTAGDLRRVMSDLPEPPSALQQACTPPPAAVPRPVLGRRGARILPLAALAVLGVLLIPDGEWPFPAFFEVVLVFALIVCAATIIAAARFRQRIRRR
jgi:DNA-binding PadR family transcriptional regulator